MLAKPMNPPLKKTGKPKPGETRLQNGVFEQKNPITGQWRAAIRMDTIRSQLISDAAKGGAYSNARKTGQETDNVTAFLTKDKDFGIERDQRPQILFELYPPQPRHFKEPSGVMMFQGRVVLDGYDHAVRDFPDELPDTLCTEMDGCEVEYYLRQNQAIKPYDLMARCRSNYMDSKGRLHNGPPRIATLTERATKFRVKAGLFAWTEKLGTKQIADHMKSLLPSGATDSRALKEDLDVNAQKSAKAGNTGKYSYRRPKAKREAGMKSPKHNETWSDTDQRGDKGQLPVNAADCKHGHDALIQNAVDEDSGCSNDAFGLNVFTSPPSELESEMMRQLDSQLQSDAQEADLLFPELPQPVLSAEELQCSSQQLMGSQSQGIESTAVGHKRSHDDFWAQESDQGFTTPSKRQRLTLPADREFRKARTAQGASIGHFPPSALPGPIHQTWENDCWSNTPSHGHLYKYKSAELNQEGKAPPRQTNTELWKMAPDLKRKSTLDTTMANRSS